MLNKDNNKWALTFLCLSIIIYFYAEKTIQILLLQVFFICLMKKPKKKYIYIYI